MSGVVTAGIGQAFGAVGSMGIGGEIARAYTHGFANGMISQFTGGDFMQGFAAGGLGSLAGSAFMMYGGSFANSTIGTYTFSGLAGGVGAELTGGNFWQGAGIGLITAGLNHLAQTVGEAVQSQPPQCREVFLLCKKDGWSHKKIAEKMNISTATVNNHIVQAIKKLKYLLDNKKNKKNS